MSSDEIPPPPFSSRVNVDIFGMTDKGKVRANNEDHFLIIRAGRALETVMTNLTVDETMPGELFEEAAHGLVVADGVGGEAAGEVASRQAIYTLLSLALHRVRVLRSRRVATSSIWRSRTAVVTTSPSSSPVTQSPLPH